VDRTPDPGDNHDIARSQDRAVEKAQGDAEHIRPWALPFQVGADALLEQGRSVTCPSASPAGPTFHGGSLCRIGARKDDQKGKRRKETAFFQKASEGDDGKEELVPSLILELVLFSILVPPEPSRE